MRALIIFPLLLVMCGVFKTVCVTKTERNSRVLTEIVLIGATGDLAKKYLWNGFFELYRKNTKSDELVHIYGAAREDNDVGQRQLQEILSSKIKCDSSLKSTAKINCESWKSEFIERARYQKLKKDNDYEVFCKGLDSNGAAKLVRIFYLSVPPFAYGTISKSIHKHCRPLKSEALLRVVLEKPFGADLESALSLSSELEKYFQEDEIYRVDHYLGKIGVQQILNFRKERDDTYGSLWNRDHIQSVEIALKEKDDCKRRTEFYNQYGVLRDVMQNHMTEIMALVAMEIHSVNNFTSMSRSKLQFLNDIEPIHRHSTVVGQYKEYMKHCEQERGKADPIDHTTPTFAAVVLYSKNSRWSHVPFFIVSGKQLAERTAHVRVVFHKKFTIDSSQNSETSCSLRQIIFHIQGGVLKKPSLVISKSLPKISKFSNWKRLESKPEFLYGCPGSAFDIYEAPVARDTYTVLIDTLYHGKKEHFVGTQDLLASWRVWSPLVHSLKSSQPRVYSQDSLKMLDFTLVGKTLQFVTGSQGSCSLKDTCATEGIVNRYSPNTFGGTTLITGSLNKVVKNLAEHILNVALQAVANKGVFHLALSGGTTPSYLFEQLVYFLPEFPWHATHVWFVDERCVDFASNLSNYNFVHTKLLRHVSVLSINVHPMPIILGSGMCFFSDKGAEVYQSQIKSIIGKPRFDYVLLGMGTDGHVASIFPSTNFLPEKNWVTLTESIVLDPKGLRMTLTLEIINKASNIGILVLGEKKAKIVRKVSHLEAGEVLSELPVLAVKPEDGELVWYIDDAAMKGFDNNT